MNYGGNNQDAEEQKCVMCKIYPESSKIVLPPVNDNSVGARIKS